MPPWVIPADTVRAAVATRPGDGRALPAVGGDAPALRRRACCRATRASSRCASRRATWRRSRAELRGAAVRRARRGAERRLRACCAIATWSARSTREESAGLARAHPAGAQPRRRARRAARAAAAGDAPGRGPRQRARLARRPACATARRSSTRAARPAFHDLLDPQGGYVRGAQIEFLTTHAARLPRGRPRAAPGAGRARHGVADAVGSRSSGRSSFRVDTGLRTRS